MVHCVVWSPILRTFIETFVELGFCAFLNILYVSGTHSPQISFDSVADIVSSGLSIVILLILLMLPFIILHILGVPPDTLTNKAYKDKFGEIYENTQRSQSYTRGLFYPLFLMHRYFLIFIVFAAESVGPGQACLMIVATGFFLYYLVQWKPFNSSVDFALNILSTILLIVLYLFCLMFSIFSDSTSMSL